MRATKRLRDLERGLSAKQIVLTYIQEGRRYTTMLEHAEAILAAGLPPRETLCDQIEAAVEEAARGQPTAARRRAVRAAQRDGLFLMRLAQLCNTRLLESARERSLEMALLTGGLALCIHEAREGNGLDRLTDWLEAAGLMLHDRRAELLAVRIIERSYFDGTPILYSGEETRVLEQIREVVELAARFTAIRAGLSARGAGKKQARKPEEETGPAAVDVAAAAKDRAASLVMSARVRTLDEVNETGEATRVLLRYVSKFGLAGTPCSWTPAAAPAPRIPRRRQKHEAL